MLELKHWFDRKKWLARLQPERAQSRPYKLFQIESSLSCGLSCVMCPWTEMRSQAGVMDWVTFEKIAAGFHLTEAVDLTGGGEPLQNRAIPEMVRVAKAAGCEVGFSTNGVHLDRALAENLIHTGLDWISFSVDAAEAGTYNRIRQGADFERVLANIRGLRELKRQLASQLPKLMMVFVMMVGENENIQQLPAYIQLAHELGVEQVIAKNLDVILKDGDDQRRVFSHDSPPGAQLVAVMEAARQQATALGVSLRFYSMQPTEQTICEQNPVKNLFFNWEGNVSPCITLSYADNRYFNGQRIHVPCLHFGNIHEQSLAEIWTEPDYRAFRQIFEDRQHWERQSFIDLMLSGKDEGLTEMPLAPESCRTCYYLYGI
jgi:MoaA/NifB/PqqE/SkfB family radical SAM enzyme